ncbi:Xylulose kinase [Kluyvera cryocrescens]|uniref:Xylulose kinase n=1 Tax=Kluyvera cryocrescens TaxID=580 RepID=A0A485AL46_KLUCR|nr:Xylulose kinase [Kluyvera cryocrescens]
MGFALADGMDVVHACGVEPKSITLIGGGARSAYWRQMLADISGKQLDYRTGGDVGPALGAARLAQLAIRQDSSFAELLPQLALEQAHHPDAERGGLLRPATRNLPPDLSATVAVNVLISLITRPLGGGLSMLHPRLSYRYFTLMNSETAVFLCGGAVKIIALLIMVMLWMRERHHEGYP